VIDEIEIPREAEAPDGDRSQLLRAEFPFHAEPGDERDPEPAFHGILDGRVAPEFERAQEILLDDVYKPRPEHRDFAWRYLWRLSRREVAPLGRHDAPVRRIELSPDGRTLASASNDRTVRIWDLARGECRSVLPGRYSVAAAAFSPDGHTLASAGVSRTIRLWDPVTGQELLGLDDNRGQVNALAFSPDGHALLSADHAGFVRIYRGTPD
jgi:hypothetical protein